MLCYLHVHKKVWKTRTDYANMEESIMERTLEEKKRIIRDLRPIDDVCFEVLAENKDVVQEILRTILEDDKLIVNDVIVQRSERNIYGRSVRLDALCTLGDGSKCNIEVQRSNEDNHLKRARFNAASITVKDSFPGEHFEEILELYIVHISEFDFLNGDKTIYHIDKIARETGQVVQDGLHEIFVNTAVDDGTDIAELMSCFVKKEIKNSKFPCLSSEMERIKTTEGGLSVMCKEWKQDVDEARAEGIAKGHASGVAEGVEKTKLETAKAMLKDGVSPEKVSLYTGLSSSEITALSAQ